MKSIIIGIFVLGGLLSCNSPQLRKDPVMSSVKAGYNSIEIDCGPPTILGIAGCVVREDQPTSSVNLRVRVIHKGTLGVHSRICNVDWTVVYDQGNNTGWVRIPLDKILGERFIESCLLTIVMRPSFEGQEDDTIQVSGMRGQAYIKVLDDNAIPAQIKIRDRFGYSGLLPIQVRSPVGVFTFKESITDILVGLNGSEAGVWQVKGCGSVLEGAYSKQTDLILNMLDLVDLNPGGCIYQGAIVPNDRAEDLLFTIVIETFNPSYIILPVPLVEIDGKKLKIQGSEFVSFTEVNGETVNGNIFEVKFNPEERYEVRQVTVKGRYLFGIYEGGIWTWVQ